MNRVVKCVCAATTLAFGHGCDSTASSTADRARLADYDAHPSTDRILLALASPSPSDFLESLPEDVDQALLDDLRSLAWLSVPPSSPTGMQGVIARGTTVFLDRSFILFVDSLFQKFSTGETTEKQLVSAANVLDAVLSGILRRHEILNDASIEQSGLSLTYAALERAALSHQLRKLGLVPVPLTPDQIDQLAQAAENRDYTDLGKLP